MHISWVYLTGHVVIMTSQNAFADVKNVISIVSVSVNSALVETLNQMPEIGGSEILNKSWTCYLKCTEMLNGKISQTKQKYHQFKK